MAGLSLLMSKGSSEDTLRLVFNCYLAQQGQPVDGTGQLGPDGLQSALEVRRGRQGICGLRGEG